MHSDLIDHSEVYLGLRERRYDCVLNREPTRLHDEAPDDLNVEILYDLTIIVAAGAHSKWARRRKIDLAKLIDEPWILAGPTSRNRTPVEEVFRARGLSAPEPSVVTDSIILRARLVAGGPYLSMFSTSALRRLVGDNYALVALPVDLHAIAFSVGSASSRVSARSQHRWPASRGAERRAPRSPRSLKGQTPALPWRLVVRFFHMLTFAADPGSQISAPIDGRRVNPSLTELTPL